MSFKKTTLLASLGAGLEYYDFIVYGLLANYLAIAFFPTENSLAATLKVFSVFALGYFVRPLGGIFFGHIGDRYGRKKVFLASLALMATATLLMGLLPTYAHAGLFASFGLVILRAIQGFAFGAEMPGTITFLVEHVAKNKRGLQSGMLLASVSVGGLLASGLLSLLNHLFSPTEMAAFGWRIPFLLGGVVAVIAYFIRSQLHETPLFIQEKDKLARWPIKHAFTQFPLKILFGIGAGLLGTCFVIFQISLPTFLQKFYFYNSTQTYLAISVSFVWAIFILPLIGKFTDRIGYAKLIVWTSLVVAVSCFELFKILEQHTLSALIIFILILQSLTSFLACGYLALLTELFPTRVRLSGVAICYNGVYLLGSLLPLSLTQWIAYSRVESVFLFFMFLAMLTFITSLIILKHPSFLTKN